MTPPIVELERVTKRFGGVTAVDEVSLALHPGRTLGVVGESGCGKTTRGRPLLSMQQPHAWRVILDGEDLGALSHEQLRRRRSKMQIIVQDP